MGGPEGGASLKDPTTTALKIEVARLEELERSAHRMDVFFLQTSMSAFSGHLLNAYVAGVSQSFHNFRSSSWNVQRK